MDAAHQEVVHIAMVIAGRVQLPEVDSKFPMGQQSGLQLSQEQEICSTDRFAFGAAVEPNIVTLGPLRLQTANYALPAFDGTNSRRGVSGG